MFEQLLKNRGNKGLRHNEAMCRSCMQNAPLGVLVMDLNGFCLEVNRAMTRMLGYDAGEIIGKAIQDLADSGWCDTLKVHLESAGSDGVHSRQILFRCKDDSAMWGALQVVKLGEDRLIVFCQDITIHIVAEQEMRQAKEAAETANKIKSNFLTNMSHELRTPLSGVVGVTELLRNTDLDALQREYVGIIRTSSELLLELINDLLTFARVEAGKLELHPQDFNLSYLMNDALALLRLQASEKNLHFDCVIEADVPAYLHCDSTRLSQIVINLVSNAIKFTGNGSIKVNVRLISQTTRSATLGFSVGDTGIGIPQGRLEAIFAPFTQVDGSTSRKYGGTGLGLSICRQLATLMGSSISVESIEGVGSTFSFAVELKKQSGSKKQLSKGGEENTTERVVSGAMVDKGRILLAEDHSTNRRVIKMMISSLGYRVDAVANGSLAVSALESAEYDLVLMDCQMPVMNGYQATAMIRDPQSAVRNHSIPVIALTANALEEIRRQCLAAGMNDFITKPVLVRQLEEVLGKWLANPAGNFPVDPEAITLGVL
ncbi:MAG: ATP-binding protein [Deltaproteobacteria bacterium]|nr:ATP-binding protein [Deltaproteobacteria bacterium]